MSHLVPVREYENAAEMLAAYEARRQRLSALFGSAPREAQTARHDASDFIPAVRRKSVPVRKTLRTQIGVRWSPEEVEALRQMHSERRTCRQTAQALGRSTSSVNNKGWTLGLTFEPAPKPLPKALPIEPTKRDWLKIASPKEDPVVAARDAVLRAIVEETGVPLKDLQSHGRVARLVEARQAAYLMLSRHTLLSSTQIGRALGGRDHSTVLFGIDAAELRELRSPEFASLIARITSAINASATKVAA